MKTEIETNKYISDLKRYGADICAETLLGVMRPEVETILSQFPDWDNPAVSQSFRASAVIPLLKDQIKSMLGTGIEKTVPLLKQRRILQDFLAVHRTVWLLEGKPL
jgi:hypothetical protein